MLGRAARRIEETRRGRGVRHREVPGGPRGAPRDVTPGESSDWPPGPGATRRRLRLAAREARAWGSRGAPCGGTASWGKRREERSARCWRCASPRYGLGVGAGQRASGHGVTAAQPCVSGAGPAVWHVRVALRRGAGSVRVVSQENPARPQSAGGNVLGNGYRSQLIGSVPHLSPPCSSAEVAGNSRLPQTHIRKPSALHAPPLLQGPLIAAALLH